MKRTLLWLLLVVFLVACGGAGSGSTAEPTTAPPTPAATAAEEGAAEATPTEEAAPPTTEPPAELTHVRLPMGYFADPQFAPFYVAIERGYYTAEGIELEFDYSFETDGIALVGAGELPFTIASGEQILLARAQNVPVVYVMEWFQRFPIAVVSKAEAGIASPQDLAGRSVGIPGFWGASYVGYAGLLSANGMALEEVNTSEIGFTQMDALLTDQVEAAVVYSNNEPLQLAAQGVDVNVIQVADYIDLVTNGLATNETTIAENPELITAFVRATLRGLADTLADPAAAYEISKKYVEGLDDSRRNVLDASIELWQTDNLGITDPASWERTQQVLLEIGFLDAPLADLSVVYTNEFVEAAQP
ncbi:MAG: ABC transporter substrate-binding protein [Chloroflexi bacterium]|nr:ABC transporter substrate-binding protein [Chloroflexota bacterium]MCI0579760.1 ABC transporter substrate-binding protein [Chloroflexota bacterium]MCI0648313.1 ABC transporter substrate-binding protein [Chloroflexota bacterium]